MSKHKLLINSSFATSLLVFRVFNKHPCTAQADDLNYRKESKDKIALPVLYIQRSLGVPHLSLLQLLVVALSQAHCLCTGQSNEAISGFNLQGGEVVRIERDVSELQRNGR